MAQVVRNPDNTLTVTLTAKEKNAAQRWAAEHVRSVESQVERELVDLFQSWIAHYRTVDGQSLSDRYESASPAIRAQVEALLPVVP